MNEKTSLFTVKFRGVRGSHPTQSADMLKYGGNTACIEVNVNGHLIIIDSGTGIINLGNDLLKTYIASGSTHETRSQINAVLLISHTHHDHIQGFPFFKPAYLESTNIHMFGPKSQGYDLEKTLSQTMFTPFFPVDMGEMAANIKISNIRETDLILLHPNNPVPEIRRCNYLEDYEIDKNIVMIQCIKTYAHPKDGTMIYKISWKNKSVVYASDKESYLSGDKKLVSFARNTDILIHDAQYSMDDYTSPIVPKQGFGHSTPEMAIEAAKLSNAKMLVLFHLDPSYNYAFINKIEINSNNFFSNCIVAHENLE